MDFLDFPKVPGIKKMVLDEREKMDAILTGYIEEALSRAEYDKLEDGTFSGRIPECKGVIAFADTLRNCETELRSVLEDWVFVGLKLGHPLPVMDGYDLNREPSHEPMEAV